MMPGAVILDLDSYRRRGARNSRPASIRILALDNCEDAYRRCDWKAFDRWFRVLAMTREPPLRCRMQILSLPTICLSMSVQ
jgi:hypothetical protein